MRLLCNQFQSISSSFEEKKGFVIKWSANYVYSWQVKGSNSFTSHAWSSKTQSWCTYGAGSALVLQTRHTGAQQGCWAWMLNLRPVGCFIQRYKQVQGLLHASSRGASMDWIVKQCGTSLLTPRVQIPSIHSRESPDFENPVVHSNWNLNSNHLTEVRIKSASLHPTLQNYNKAFWIQITDKKKVEFLSCEHQIKKIL